MKKKLFKEKYSTKAKKKPVKDKKKNDYKWIRTITISAFLISLIFSFLSETIIPNVTLIVALLITLLFIFIGIIFDMIGISVTVADLKTFNSMASKQVKGASLAVKLTQNASKVSSFCNDVIGDICGIISGSTGIAISTIIASKLNCDILVVTLIVTATIASLTIGGKALGKSVAMNKSTLILYRFSKALSIFVKK